MAFQKKNPVNLIVSWLDSSLEVGLWVYLNITAKLLKKCGCDIGFNWNINIFLSVSVRSGNQYSS